MRRRRFPSPMKNSPKSWRVACIGPPCCAFPTRCCGGLAVILQASYCSEASACFPTRRLAMDLCSGTKRYAAHSRRSCRETLRARLRARLRQARPGGAENLLERRPQRDVDVSHGHGMAEIDQACDAIAGIDHAAGYDRSKMRQVRFDIDGDAMERHPAFEPHADRGDLVLKACALVRPPDPDADAFLPTLATHVEHGQGADDPFLQCRDIGADVRPAPLQIEHYIGHTLAGAVIGDLSAAPGRIKGKAGLKQVG